MKRYAILGIAILIAAAALAGVGVYLKYDVLKPMGIYQDKSIFELPFLMYSDDYLQFMVEHRDEILEMMPPATEPSRPTAPTNGTVPNTSIPTVPTTTVPAVPTVPGTDPTDHTGTLPPVTTVPPTTQTPTTQTPTTQTPTTQPPVTQPTKPKDEPNFDFPVFFIEKVRTAKILPSTFLYEL